MSGSDFNDMNLCSSLNHTGGSDLTTWSLNKLITEGAKSLACFY